ncbi:kinase-like protein [Aaosphaeria arxii CBS 175.79]|uniref:Kinase-like protein n=1 Tax=Aaosphaeria arxii CBS 175.79 TaxID=1450172 RepID=A0A6A5XLA2_9PLEO|nr:kinase-like protein [Aaosphaeria arxii CBS 175.79]KAF2013520.1 kinase-like protein [Aaosphaeria arxii CBS 175.79]
MTLNLGQVLPGMKWNYRLIECIDRGTACSSVFKAEVLPGGGHQSSFKENVKAMLRNERKYYANPAIRSCSQFRALCDVIDSPEDMEPELGSCLAFEWMDCTLADLSPESHKSNSTLHKSVSEAMLSALDVLGSQRLIHADVKNDNILISNIDGPSPIVKLGDLGLVRPEGFNKSRLQAMAMRAPEVWSGIGCFHTSDVWSFAATLFDWFRPSVFGDHDTDPWFWNEPYGVAKMLRLFPGSVTANHSNHPTYEAELKIGTMVEAAGDRAFTYGDFDEELGKLDVAPSLADFLRYLLVVDHTKRPTAGEALKSEYFSRLA